MIITYLRDYNLFLYDLSIVFVIIGAGGGGLAAALEAKNAGSEVILVEKMPMVGGNTLRATGGMNAAGTSSQAAIDIEDSIETHFDDTMKGGYDKNDPELVKVMTDNAADAIEWLISIGADLSDVGRLGGASNNRAHRPTGGAPVGSHIVKVLKENVEKAGVELLLDTEATEILYEDGKVTGILAKNQDGKEFTIEAKAVIIAAGGFGANSTMVTELDSALDGFGAIIINREGNRFVNEISTRDVVSEAILEQEGKTAFLFFDEAVRESLSAIDGYIEMGLTIEGESIEEIAELLEVDPANLEATLAGYNGFVDSASDADFERPDMPTKLEKAKYYAIEIGPAVHHTMGGIHINPNSEVLNKDGGVISGLFAAGEVTGGVHGGNRLGGNALADIIVFGRIAGKSSAEYIK